MIQKVTAQFRGFIVIDVKNISQSKVQLELKHEDGWRPLFEFNVQDVMRVLYNKRIVQKKGNVK